jgi:N-methylhydantoinase A
VNLGIDIGGTFTDFVLVDDAGRVRLHKRLTTPADPAHAVVEGVDELGFPAQATAQVVHGSTIATNALLERRGARTALIATAGFADVLEIGRQNRPELYALVPERPEPLVPRAWRFELAERVSADGQILTPLDPAAVEGLAPRLAAESIESVAVVFLYAYLRPEHEQLVQRALQGAGTGLHVSISSEVLPEYREFERTAATAINAYVAPIVDRYLARLEQRLSPRRLRIMQSNGGAITAATARHQAARTALSGPAGGVVGAFAVAQAALGAAPHIIGFDMGGTSTDVCLCPGSIPFTSEGEIAALGLPLRLPIIDIHTVGAGGGSLARLDEGGALVVGPESAGADPGPACYGRGGQQATVTDANLVLRRLDTKHFLGGRMQLDTVAAQAALEHLAAGLRRETAGRAASAEHAAWGVVQVANAAMERAIRRISVERGYDPADFTLVAFGGAGPLHACELAERLGLPQVLVPRAPGVLSALGMLVADLVSDYSTTVMQPLASLAASELGQLFAAWEARARAEMARELGQPATAVRLERSLDLRYSGQSFEINVPAVSLDPAALAADFHARHGRRYGHAHPDEPVEVVNLRVRAIGPTPQPQFEALARGGEDPQAAQVGVQEAFFDGPGGPKTYATRLYERAGLLSGNIVGGPAVIFQLDATSVVPPGWAGEVTAGGHLLLRPC